MMDSLCKSCICNQLGKCTWRMRGYPNKFDDCVRFKLEKESTMKKKPIVKIEKKEPPPPVNEDWEVKTREGVVIYMAHLPLEALRKDKQ